jgi:membrane-bound lytic murein transglycosylase D
MMKNSHKGTLYGLFGLILSVFGCSASDQTGRSSPEEVVQPQAPTEDVPAVSPQAFSDSSMAPDPDDGEGDDSDNPSDTPVEIDQALASADKKAPPGPTVADAVISDELKQAEIPIEINAAVQQWIEYFTVKDRERFQRFMERGEKYKPMVMAALKDQGIPTELYYQAMIESGFAVHATSSAKAVGIWQFIKGTGRRYGLRIDSYVDERRDPVRSTIAAALYLKDLNNVFQSWYLAMASYNAGEGRILNAIMRGKSRDFWQLARDRALPSETMHYIPKFLAATIIGHNPRRYGMDELPPSTAPDLVSVKVPSPIRLQDLAQAAGISLDQTRELNPHILRGVTPPGMDTYRVWVPKEAGSSLEGSFDRLASLRVRGLSPDRAIVQRGGAKYYTVTRGETLADVAQKHGISLRSLKRLNRLKSSRVAAGTRLRVPSKNVALASADEGVLSYKVRRGDNLDKVARRFGVTVSELKKLNGLRRNRLEVGQVLSLKAQRI